MKLEGTSFIVYTKAYHDAIMRQTNPINTTPIILRSNYDHPWRRMFMTSCRFLRWKRHRTRRYVTYCLQKTFQLTLSWARRIQSTSPHTIFNTHFNIIFQYITKSHVACHLQIMQSFEEDYLIQVL